MDTFGVDIDIIVKDFQSRLKKDGTSYELIIDLVGYPLWDFTIERTSQNSSSLRYLTPCYDDDNRNISAVIQTYYNYETNTVSHNVIKRNTVEYIPIREEIVLTENGKLSQLSREFVTAEFAWFENTLFNNGYEDLLTNHPDFHLQDVEFRGCVSYTVWFVESCTHTIAGGNHTAECTSYYEFEYVGCAGGSGVVVGSNNGGDSGSSNGNPANVGDPQNLIDPVIHPCAHLVANQILSETTSILANMMSEIFNESSNFNLSIQVGTLPTNTNGQSVLINNSGTTGTYDGLITINSEIASCTKDRLYATMMHEMIHSYIDGMRQSLDPNEFNDRFPLYNDFSFGSPDATELAHHNLMADAFIMQFTIALRAFNPNISPQHARDLAWSGLRLTYAWGRLSPARQNEILQTNAHSRCQGGMTPSPEYNFLPC